MTHYRLSQFEMYVAEQGQGPALLLVHGFPLDHSMWRHQLEALAVDHRVIAPDLRGFGRSSATPGTVTMQQYADDLAELLDLLSIDEPVAFCGLSMGGYIAWPFWQRHRARLGRLILCDTRAASDTAAAMENRYATARRIEDEGTGFLAETMAEKLFSAQSREGPCDRLTATLEVIRRTAPDGAAAALRGMAQRQDMRSDLSGIDLPTLVLCGQEDALTPAGEMRAMAEALPNASFVAIPAAGHMAPLENPLQVNAAIRDFLDGKRTEEAVVS